MSNDWIPISLEEPNTASDSAPESEPLATNAWKPIPRPTASNGVLTDSLINLGQGALKLPSAIAGLADIPAGLAGANRPFSKAADYVADKTGLHLSQMADEGNKELSPQLQEEQGNVNKAWEEGGAANIASSYLHNPRAVLSPIIESLPLMGASGAVARGLGAAVPALADTLQGGKVVKSLAPARYALGDVAMTAGNTMANIDPNVDARKAAESALVDGAFTGLVDLASGHLANKLGLENLGNLAAGQRLNQGVREGARNLHPATRIVGGATLEAGEEALQNPVDQMSQNYAEDKPLTQGAARAAVEGALAGGVMGGASNAFSPSTYANNPNQNTGALGSALNAGGPPTDSLAPNAPNINAAANDAENQAKADADLQADLKTYNDLTNKAKGVPDREETHPITGDAITVKGNESTALSQKELDTLKEVSQKKEVQDAISEQNRLRQEQQDIDYALSASHEEFNPDEDQADTTPETQDTAKSAVDTNPNLEANKAEDTLQGKTNSEKLENAKSDDRAISQADMQGGTKSSTLHDFASLRMDNNGSFDKAESDFNARHAQQEKERLYNEAQAKATNDEPSQTEDEAKKEEANKIPESDSYVDAATTGTIGNAGGDNTSANIKVAEPAAKTEFTQVTVNGVKRAVSKDDLENSELNSLDTFALKANGTIGKSLGKTNRSDISHESSTSIVDNSAVTSGNEITPTVGENGSDVLGEKEVDSNPILTLPKKTYLLKKKREYEKANPNVPKATKEAAVKGISGSYENDLNKASAELPFEQYKALPINKGQTESILKQAHDSLRVAYKINQPSSTQATESVDKLPEIADLSNNDQAKIPQVAQPTLMQRNVELNTVNGTTVKGDRYLFPNNERHPIIITKPYGNKGAATKQNHIAWDEKTGAAIYSEPAKPKGEAPSSQHVIDVVSSQFNAGLGLKLDSHESRKISPAQQSPEATQAPADVQSSGEKVETTNSAYKEYRDLHDTLSPILESLYKQQKDNGRIGDARVDSQVSKLEKQLKDAEQKYVKSVDEKRPDVVNSEMADLKDQMGQAIGELASLLGGKHNLTEEEETKLLPIMSKIFRIAAKMGYAKFKDSAGYVMQQIRELAGNDVADKLALHNLQAGYINMGGNIRDTMAYDTIGQLEKDYVKNGANPQENNHDHSETHNTGATNDSIGNISETANTSGVSNKEQKQPKQSGATGSDQGLRTGREQHDSVDSKQSQGDGLSGDEGLVGHKADVSTQHAVGGQTSTNGSVSESIGSDNYSLLDKKPIALTPAKRRDVNILAEEILKKPVNDITEDDKNILRQYTGNGGLDLKASADKGDSIFNQHYSAYDTIKSMYGALMDAGIKMVNNLEPSVGSGNFIGMHPQANWTAVDIDKVNTEIVARLYPDAKVFNESYETFRGKGYDLIISNVPFASFSSLAREYAGTIKPMFKAIHNFFFAQSIDKLKTGGVMAFMTSTGTMDGVGEGQRLRQHLVSQMDVIGAFRLPMGTQKANASTDVMIDVIFLQKRPEGVASKQADKNQSFVNIASKDGHKINQYFVDYPESILGELSIGANKTSMGKVGWIVTGEADYSKMKIEPQDYTATKKAEQDSFTNPDAAQQYADKNGLKFIDGTTKPFFKDGIIYDKAVSYSEFSGGGLFGRKATGVSADKMAALQKIDETHDAELVHDYENKYSKPPHTDKLLELWAKNVHAVQQLKSYLSLFDKHFGLSDIFTKQVRFENSGKIEVDEHSSLYDRAESLENADGILSTKTDLLSADEIQGLLDSNDYAKLPNGDLQNARLYYAGNIYEKLDDAAKVKPAAQRDKQIERLTRAKPTLIPIKDITLTGKETWLPDSAIAAIGKKTYHDGTIIIGDRAIDDNHLLDLFNQYLNNDKLVAKGRDDTPEEYADRLKVAQDTLHNEVLPLIKQRLLDDGLADEVVDAYNRTKNFFAEPIFDGLSLKNLPETFRGKPFKLMQHQLEGAERAIYNKKGVLAFSPGLGKTPTAIVVADQLLQKGVMKKPLFIVPANTIPQWEATTRDLYPNAKVYEFPKYTSGINKGKPKDWPSMSAADKEKMAYDLTNNQYDYTFISINLAQKFTIPPKRLGEYVDKLTESISSMEKDDEDLTKSQIKAKATRIAKIRMLKATIMVSYADSNANGFDMGKMGFDALFADEVQYYKNIGMQSEDAKGGIGANVAINAKYPMIEKNGKMVADMTQSPLSVSLGSSRSYDFRFKTQFISENNNGNNIFLLTGTPTPNKPLELLTLLFHLDTKILDEYHIDNVGQFVDEFLDIQAVEETAVDGAAKLKDQLVAIKNVFGLKKIISRYIDYRSPESASDLTRPKQKDVTHIILQSDESQEIFEDVQARILQAVEDSKKKRSGGIVEEEKMIAMYGAGRDASVDVRLYTPSKLGKGNIADGTVFQKETRSQYSKIAKTVELVAAKNKLDPEAGQLIFLDRLKFSSGNGSTHEDIRNDILEATGLNPNQVVFVNGGEYVNPNTGKIAKNIKPEMLQTIMDDYNAGKIKVLIGNTTKLGVGVDLQTTTTDIYQLDKPYRPDEIEQRNNRGVRQGNRNAEVTVHSFNQPGTFDAMSDRIIESKQGFNDVFWKTQTRDKANVKGEEAPGHFDAAIELERDPLKKRKLEIQRDLNQASAKKSQLEKQVSSLAKRIRSATEAKTQYENANQGIDTRAAPKYEDQTEAERKKSITSWQKRQAEQRALNVGRIADISTDLTELEDNKTQRSLELEAHNAHVANIRDKYVVNGVVSLDAIKNGGNQDAALFSKAQSQVTNPHTQSSLHAAISKALDKVFGQDWTQRLEATGKFKLISAAEAVKLIGADSMFHKDNGSKDGNDKTTQKTVNDFAQEIKDKLNLKAFVLFDRKNGDIELSSLIVNKEDQKKGIGSQAMAELTDYADATGRRVILSAGQRDDNHGTSSHARLIKFYKRFGFKENKGRSIDFELGAGKMYRNTVIAKYSKDGQVLAFYNPADDTTYFVHDHISQDTSAKALVGLVLHEVGVHALQMGKTNDAFQALLKRFEAMKATNTKVQAAFDRVPADTKVEDKLEEALAYFIEHNVDSPLSKRIIEAFRQLVRAIGNAIKGTDKLKFMQWANKLTETELRNMAVSALRNAPSDLQFDNVGRETNSIKLAKEKDYKGNDNNEASEWLSAVDKGLDMSKEARMARAKAMGYDTETIYSTNSIDEKLSEIKKKEDIGNLGGGVFDGIFLLEGDEGGNRGYPYTHQFIAREDKVAGKRDRDLDFNKSMAYLTKEYGNDLDETELERLYDLTAYDEDIWDGGNNVLEKIGYDDLGYASWEAQNIRGKLAIDQGFDLIAMQDEEGISYFAPYGSKIRSINAAFDPDNQSSSNILASKAITTNDTIKFSRSTPANTPQDDAAITDIFNKIAGDKSLEYWGGAFTRNQLIEFIIPKVPSMINYKLLSQKKDNATHSAEQDIAMSYDKMSELIKAGAIRTKGLLRGTVDNAQARRAMIELSRVMSEATALDNFDPEQSNDNAPKTPEEKAVYYAYKALPESSKDIYVIMRDDYKSDLDKTWKALISNLDRFPIDSRTKGAVIAEIKAHFHNTMSRGVYFPLSRFGNNVVTGINKKGERVVSFVEGNRARDRLVREMIAQEFDPKSIKTTIKKVYEKELMEGNAANNIAVLAKNTIEDIRDKLVKGTNIKGDINEMLKDFHQELLQALPDTSYRKHFIHRKGTLGESADALRAYANTRVSSAKHLSSLEFDYQIAKTLIEGNKAIKDLDLSHSDYLNSIMNEFVLREKALKEINIQSWAQALTSLGFMGALGGNIASAGVNMLQVASIGLPELSGKHGFAQASMAISKAYQLILNPAVLNKQSGFDLMQNPAIDKLTKDALLHLHKIGKIDLTQTHDSIAAGQNPSFSQNPINRAFGSIAKKSGYFFHVAEALNRQVMGIAAFNLEYKRLGGAQGKSMSGLSGAERVIYDQALAYSEKAIDDTQFDYSQGNRARFMMGNAARVLTLFKAYAINTSFYIGRNAALSLAKLPSAERLQARKTLFATMAMSFATAGLFGMPIGVEAMIGIGGVTGFKRNGATGALVGSGLGLGATMLAAPIMQALLVGLGADDDDDLENQFRNWLTDNFNAGVAEVLTKGLARLLPIGDISGHTSMSNLWHQPSNKELEGKDEFLNQMQMLLGPVASQVANAFMAKKLYDEGNLGRAVESVMPRAISNAVAASRMESNGVKTLKGDKVIDRELTLNEVIQKAIGFSPTVVANALASNAAISKADQKITMKKDHLIQRYFNASPEGKADLFNGDIAEFNKDAEFKDRITRGSLLKRQRSMKAADRHTQNGLYLGKSRENLRDLGRWNTAD